MFLRLVLFIAIIFQIVAAFLSLRLMRKTKYNLSWIFISLGFASLLMRMILEALPFYFNVEPKDYRLLYMWLGVSSAIFFAIGLVLIRKIFIYMEKMENETRANEKRLLAVMIQAEENERKRLAKDLHDGLGPLLSTVKMSLSALKKSNNTETNSEIINNLETVTIEAIRSIKDISNNLSPHVLDNFGLDKAIRNFLQKIINTGTIKIVYNSNINNHRFDANTEAIIYRVVCELVNNTIKHAKAKKIIINLNYDLFGIKLDYKDDGSGFETNALFKSQEKGTGLYNIISRIHSLKGKVEFNSSTGKGTEVLIEIPFNNE